MSSRNGGEQIAQILATQGVRFLFTLCGGHISPILVEAKRQGIRVVDVRDEATAVFAADAVARLTGVPGVAAVTAGPGVTNTLTAVKNAQLAQTPVIVLGGATATMLEGRGSLQDIDQLALFRPHVKRATSVKRMRDLGRVLEDAFRIAQEGVPGPVFVECPVDLLYDESVVRGWYRSSTASTGSGKGAGFASRIERLYMDRHLRRLFAGKEQHRPAGRIVPETSPARVRDVEQTAAQLRRAERPVLIIGSQAVLRRDADSDAETALPGVVGELSEAVERLGVPTYLSGMARGLLGRRHPLQLRHRRREALREADVVLLAGVSCDFRLGYGRQIGRSAVLVSVNRSAMDLTLNRRPTIGVLGDPAEFLSRIASSLGEGHLTIDPWKETLRQRDTQRNEQIRSQSEQETSHINPLALCQGIERVLDDTSILVLDGGDFVGTASYIVSPRGPLSSLDPGLFGTLGVGAGFALGSKLCRPDAEVWILYGDGSSAYSLAEFDTFARHGIPVIAVVGNDACWSQIAREQNELLKDDVGTVLRRTDYHRVAEGYGGVGLMLERTEDVESVLREAQSIARSGRPVLVNAMIGTTDFRKGSISI
jgi:acetolactate synthase-like protein